MPTADYISSNGMIERRDFGGLNLSNVPKVLFESGNMQNATDAALLQDPQFRQKIADSLTARSDEVPRRLNAATIGAPGDPDRPTAQVAPTSALGMRRRVEQT